MARTVDDDDSIDAAKIFADELDLDESGDPRAKNAKSYNSNVFTGGGSIRDWINELKKDPELANEVFARMQTMAENAPQGSAVRTDWGRVMWNLTPQDQQEIIEGLRNHARNTSTGKGYEGWDSSSGKTHKEKVIAKTDEEAKEHGKEKAGDEYEIEVNDEPGTYEQMYGKPLLSKSTKTVLTDVGAPVLSNAAHTAGSAYGDYVSILGDAMQAMAGNYNMQAMRSHASPTSGFNADSAYYSALARDAIKDAGNLRASGAVAKDIGTGIDKTIREIAANSKARDDAARQAQLMINEHPVSDYWRETASIRRNAREMAKENK